MRAPSASRAAATVAADVSGAAIAFARSALTACERTRQHFDREPHDARIDRVVDRTAGRGDAIGQAARRRSSSNSSVCAASAARPFCVAP